jgi:hypothetical protein
MCSPETVIEMTITVLGMEFTKLITFSSQYHV